MTSVYCRCCGQLIYQDPGEAWRHAHSRRVACDVGYGGHIRLAEPEPEPEPTPAPERYKPRRDRQVFAEGRLRWDVPQPEPPACKGTHTYSGLHDYEERPDGSRVCRACGKCGRFSWEEPSRGGDRK